MVSRPEAARLGYDAAGDHLARRFTMSEKRKIVLLVLVISAMLTVGGLIGSVAAQKSTAPPPAEHRSAVVAGEPAAKQMLLLMDTNKDGKVSKEEWMNFMSAEFDRLDTNHDGFVNVKDMERSQIKPVPFYRAGK
jgi:hypothetical protein